MITEINDQLNNEDLFRLQGMRKYPTLAEYSRKYKRDFVNILEQYVDADPGITIDGKYYADQGSSSALMSLNNYLNDNQNVTASYTKLNDTFRDIEKQVEKLVG